MMTPEAVIGGVSIHRINDRCFVRLEQLVTYLPDTTLRAELTRYLWISDESDDESDDAS